MICVHTTAATLSHHLPSLPLPPLLSNPIPPLTSLLTSPPLFPHHLSNYASLAIPSTSPHLPSTLTYIFSSSLQPTFFNPLPSHHPPPLSPPASPLTTRLPSHHPPPLSPPASPLTTRLPSHHPPPLSPPASPLTTRLPSHHPPPLSPPTSPLTTRLPSHHPPPLSPPTFPLTTRLPSHHPPPLSPPASPLTTHLPSHHPPPLSPPTSPLSSTVLLLIGNKLDLESEREVTEEEAVRYAKGIGANHLQCSAATGQCE